MGDVPALPVRRSPSRRPSRRRWVGVALVAAVVVAATVALVARAGAGAERCEEFRAAADQRYEATTAAARARSGSEPLTLVIGDSYSVGLGVEPAQAWPARLPGRVVVDGFSGSGFSSDASECGDLSYASRADDTLREVGDFDLVVVEGGLNDFDQSPEQIEEGVRRLFEVLGDRDVLVVGPPPAPSRSTAVPVVDEQLARLTEELGGTYLSMVDGEFDYLPDRLHLTPDGHEEFGDTVAEEAEALLPA